MTPLLGCDASWHVTRGHVTTTLRHQSRVTCHTYPYFNTATATATRFPYLTFGKILSVEDCHLQCGDCEQCCRAAERILIWYKSWSEHGVCPLLLSAAELQNQVHTTAVFWPLYYCGGNLMNTLLPASTTTWVDILKHYDRISTFTFFISWLTLVQSFFGV